MILIGSLPGQRRSVRPAALKPDTGIQYSAAVTAARPVSTAAASTKSHIGHEQKAVHCSATVTAPVTRDSERTMVCLQGPINAGLPWRSLHT
jgi:hypothetical protein